MGSAELKVLPIKIQPRSAVRHWFISKYESKTRDALKPADRTLIVNNVPPYVDKESLKLMFSRYGDVHNVYVQDNASAPIQNPSTSHFDTTICTNKFKVALIVYESSSSIQQILEADLMKMEPLMVFPGTLALTGYKKMCNDYKKSMVKRKDLRKEIHDFMDNFDEKERLEKEALKLKEGQPDADGWVTVTKGPKRRHSLGTKDLRNSDKSKRKKKNTEELPNFYTFQKREAKLKHLEELQKKFEDDKKKVQLMKQARKFKPN